MSTVEEPEKWVNLEIVADHTGLSKDTIRSYIRKDAIRAKNLVRAAGQLQIDGALLYDFLRDAVEHRQPGFVGALGDSQLVSGFLCDKGLVINGILSVHGLHLGSILVLSVPLRIYGMKVGGMFHVNKSFSILPTRFLQEHLFFVIVIETIRAVKREPVHRG